MTGRLAARVVLFGFDAASSSFIKHNLADYGIDVTATLPAVGAYVSAACTETARAELAKFAPGVTAVRCARAGEEARCAAGRLASLCEAQVIFVTDCPCSKKEAENAGAFGAVVMPARLGAEEARDFCMQLMLLIRNARLTKLASSMGFHGKWVLFPPSERPKVRLHGIQLIAIGASAGGTEALTRVVSGFTAELPCVVIVQHMPRDFVPLFVSSLDKKCPAEVREACDGDPLVPGRVYVAPGGLQTTIERGEGGCLVRVREGEKISGHRPSVNALFNSVAANVGSSAIGVILTGMGEDGAEGLLSMHRAGAWTIGQDAASCVVYGMPRAAYEKGAVSVQLPLSGIAEGIKQALGAKDKSA